VQASTHKFEWTKIIRDIPTHEALQLTLRTGFTSKRRESTGKGLCKYITDNSGLKLSDATGLLENFGLYRASKFTGSEEMVQKPQVSEHI